MTLSPVQSEARHLPPVVELSPQPLGAPFPLDPIDYGTEAGRAETRLWVSVLALMLDDARRYWQGKKSHSAGADELEEAFDALIQCTWMLRRICTYTGHDAEAVSRGFNDWCLLNMA